jgi:two-component system, OmpR family, response regulator
MARKILVVDDEKRIVEIVKAYLEKDGFQVASAFEGRTALQIARKEKPDLIVLDLMLPEVNGWDVCRTLRKESDVPVIMLTARDDVTDKIVGLELGADDYVTKPFDPKELVARVKAVLRRKESQGIASLVLNIGRLRIDRDKRTVSRDADNIELTSTEFDLLFKLAEFPGRVYSRMQLLEQIQGDAYDGYERTIDSHIKNLRKKIEPNPERPRYVLTVHGTGYKIAEDPDA